GMPLGWRRQVLPPSVLRRIVPLLVLVFAPTAKQVLGLRQATPNRTVGVSLGWRRQVRPPSVPRRIVPSPPTGRQVLGRRQATPSRKLGVPLVGLLAACAAGRSDKRPPSGGATSTSGSSTDSNRCRDSPENISSTSLVLFPRAAPQTLKPAHHSNRPGRFHL